MPKPPEIALNSRKELAAAASKLVLAVCVIGLAFVQTYGTSTVAFTAVEIREILLLGALISTVPMAAALVLLRSRLCNAVLAFVVVLSVASVNLIHTDLNVSGSRILVAFAAVLIGSGLFAAFEFVDSSRWLRGGVPVAAPAALALAIVLHLQPSEGDRDYAIPVNLISFESMPNLYFVSLDGLAPQVLQQEYLDIDSTHLMDLLNAEFRRLPNLFSESPWSRLSLNSVVSLHPEIYWTAHESLPGPGFVDPGFIVGTSPSPLFDILGANGYETTFLFHNRYFGDLKGPYLDNLVTNQSRAICSLLDPSIRRIAFWGYCNLPFTDHAELEDRQGDWTTDEIARIVRSSSEAEPAFVLAYFKYPGHTQRTFDYYEVDLRDAYRDRWIDRSNQAARFLAQVIDTLKEEDPDAILFVFGDHGIRLSVNVAFEDDPEFVIKDHYGAYGGIYPPDVCASYFDDALQYDYLTVSDAVHTLLRCLSGGDEPLDDASRRDLRYNRGRLPRDGVERSFADFVYE